MLACPSSRRPLSRRPISLQPAPTGQPAAQPAEEAPAIVVTGTLISNPNLLASAPVSVVGQDELQLRQTNNAEEVLRDLPGAVPSIGSAVNNGNGGAAFADLRGLGNFRNVVLLDGQRIVPSSTFGRVDLNNIPLALVERVDTLTGGAAVTYGADAVSGVINFITRRDFAGVEMTASEQITEQGDGNIFRADATIGANFDDGRGNACCRSATSMPTPSIRARAASRATPIRRRLAMSGGSGTDRPGPLRRRRAPSSRSIPATGALQTPVVALQLQPVQHLPDAVPALQHLRRRPLRRGRQYRILHARHVLEEHGQHDHRAVRPVQLGRC